MLGFAAGVMLAATPFRLVQPGIEEAVGGAYGALVMLAGILLSVVFVDFFDKRFLHSTSFRGERVQRAG